MIFFLCQKFSYDFFLILFFLWFFSYPIFFLWPCVKKTQVFQEKLDSIGVQMEIYPYNWSKNEENNNLFYFLIDQQALKYVFLHTKNDKKYTWGQKLHDVIHIFQMKEKLWVSKLLLHFMRISVHNLNQIVGQGIHP